jgi:hypothetical protein
LLLLLRLALMLRHLQALRLLPLQRLTLAASALAPLAAPCCAQEAVLGATSHAWGSLHR